MRFVPSLVLWLALAVLVNTLASSERERTRLQEQNTANSAGVAILSKFETELKSNVYLSTGLVAYIASVDDVNREDLHAAMQGVFRAGRYIRNIGVAPDNRLDYVYPLEGNEGAIGIYYPDISTQWPQVQRAIASRTTVISGPLPLVQGGIGLVARTPVFLESGDYWGIISLVIDIKELAVGVARSPAARDVKFALRAVSGDDGQISPIWGDQNLFQPKVMPPSMDVAGGRWEISVQPALAASKGDSWLTFLTLIANAVALLSGIVLYRFQAVHREMHANRRKLQVILNTSRAAIMVYDAKGLIHEANQAANKLFSNDGKTLVGCSIHLILPGDIGVPEVNGVAYTGADADAVPMNARALDGTIIPVEIKAGETEFDGKSLNVCALRDIRDRIVYEEKLQALANTDAMTGSFNRRYFNERATESFLQAKRYGRPLSLMIFDIDHFKAVNDSYGHPTGDIVIKAVASIAAKLLRSTDILGRIGGEEFAVLMPETGATQAEVLAERLRFSIERANMTSEHGLPLQVTISIGIASFPDNSAANVDELLSVADKALYRAKQSGRNRVAA
ncbi:diguanylate cyclase [Gimibacter soli]|uniref:diguanylate cyclase n=1 Tax=Gimibacter soli TaxID=3024400 RepID=A0AAE9XQK8_9PROT|nr:diguanylate cyclase [Gimibacter soli]WCL54469.1 diguanylate cyclase [Gimibacter soli]